MCCSNWNGGGWNGRRCACRCVCWGPFGTQLFSDGGSTAAASTAGWPGCAGTDWAGTDWAAATAGTSGCGCNG